jgi:hypothetical protein
MQVSRKDRCRSSPGTGGSMVVDLTAQPITDGLRRRPADAQDHSAMKRRQRHRSSETITTERSTVTTKITPSRMISSLRRQCGRSSDDESLAGVSMVDVGVSMMDSSRRQSPAETPARREDPSCHSSLRRCTIPRTPHSLPHPGGMIGKGPWLERRERLVAGLSDVPNDGRR